MAVNLVVESPDFDRIRKGDGKATEAAVRLLWFVLNDLSRRESIDFQTVRNLWSVAVLSAAPSSNQDNYDSKDATILLFTGGSAFNLTGIRNGVEGMVKIIANLGAGTITIKHETTSDTTNRIDTVTGADKTIVTNKFMLISYLSNRWREVSLV